MHRSDLSSRSIPCVNIAMGTVEALHLLQLYGKFPNNRAQTQASPKYVPSDSVLCCMCYYCRIHSQYQLKVFH